MVGWESTARRTADCRVRRDDVVLLGHPVTQVDNQTDVPGNLPDLRRGEVVGVERNDLDGIEAQFFALVEKRQVLLDEGLVEEEGVNPKDHDVS
jgi:hypothetical protein